MMRKNNHGSAVKSLLQSGKYLCAGIFFLVSFSFQSILLAQPVTSGGLNNEIYLEDVPTAYSHTVEQSALKEKAKSPKLSRPKQFSNGLLMIAGVLFFGFITLLFLKIAAKNKVILLILGLVTLLIFNAHSQPQSPKINNQAYFGETSGQLGPVPMSPPGPDEAVPIDNGLAILAIAGILAGVYSIYNQTKKV